MFHTSIVLIKYILEEYIKFLMKQFILHIDLRLSSQLQNDKHRSYSTVPKAHFFIELFKI